MMYYHLNIDKLKIEESDIGPTMLEFSKVLYDTTGLSLNIFNFPVDEAVQFYINQFKLEYVTEEVAWKYSSNEEKIEKITRRLLEMGSEGGTLLIIDPYLFSTYTEEYILLLSGILKNSDVNQVKVITSSENCKQNVLDEIKQKSGCNLEVFFSNKWHDRFWLINELSGFAMGTSLNGLGKRISLIQELEQDDFNEILIAAKEDING